MNISSFKGRIKSNGEVEIRNQPIEESTATEEYKAQELKTGFFRKMDELCSTIYEYEDFQKHKFFKGEMPKYEGNVDLNSRDLTSSKLDP